ncbi:MAG: CBS domain protein sometimes clustered with YjeE, partial [uncultured Rubrobacteraceae bacterium]
GRAGHSGAQGRGDHGTGLAHPGARRDGRGGDQAFRRVAHLRSARRLRGAPHRHRDRGRPHLPGCGDQIPRLPGHPGRHDPAGQHGGVPQGGLEERGRHGGRGDVRRRRDGRPRRYGLRDGHGDGEGAQKDTSRRRGRSSDRRHHPHGHPHPPRPQAAPV